MFHVACGAHRRRRCLSQRGAVAAHSLGKGGPSHFEPFSKPEDVRGNTAFQTLVGGAQPGQLPTLPLARIFICKLGSCTACMLDGIVQQAEFVDGAVVRDALNIDALLLHQKSAQLFDGRCSVLLSAQICEPKSGPC